MTEHYCKKDVYLDYLGSLSPQTPSKTIRALLTRGGGKLIRVVSRYNEVMLTIDGTNIYTKTMITCGDDLVVQIFVGQEELKLRSIGKCAMLEEDTMHLGTEVDVYAHVLNIN